MAAVKPPAALSVVDTVVERFRAYLLAERALRPNLVEFYLASVRPFVSTVVVGDAVDEACLSARTVTAFVAELSRSLAAKTVQGRASALRALLRFWVLTGVAEADLRQGRHRGVVWLGDAVASGGDPMTTDLRAALGDLPDAAAPWPLT